MSIKSRNDTDTLCSRSSSRRGFSLLEVLLSMAILGMAIATIGELVRVGSLAAANTRDMTSAQLLAETKMSELTSGLYPLSPVADAVDEYDPQWNYSVEIEQIDQEGLIAVQISVIQNLPESQRPVQYQLVRWMREDDLLIEEEEETTEDGDVSSGSSGATSSGSSTDGSSSGGGR